MVETYYRLYRSNDTHRRTGDGEGERALKRMGSTIPDEQSNTKVVVVFDANLGV
jgi:hypothetical protein